MEEKTEPLVTMEVQVKSSSVAAVCGLHHAVLRRIQVHTLHSEIYQQPPRSLQVILKILFKICQSRVF